jgi:hypothetical protein
MYSTSAVHHGQSRGVKSLYGYEYTLCVSRFRTREVEKGKLYCFNHFGWESLLIGYSEQTGVRQ